MNFITTLLLTEKQTNRFRYNSGTLLGICRDEIMGAIMETESTMTMAVQVHASLTSSCTILVIYLLHTYLLHVPI